MNKKIVAPAAVAVLVIGVAVANETGLFSTSAPPVTEEARQQAEQEEMQRVAAECEMWAYEQAGIPTTSDNPERKEGSVAKSTAIGTAAGAAVGAVGGEATADKAGKGAVVGAIVGGASAFLKSRSDKKEYEELSAEKAAQLEAFEKALNTCMTAKGY